MLIYFFLSELNRRLPLVMAIRALKERNMSISGAARLFKVNKRTLYDHVKGKYKDCPKQYKRKGTSLSQTEELALVEYLKVKASSGTALRKIDVSKAFLVSLHVSCF